LSAEPERVNLHDRRQAILIASLIPLLHPAKFCKRNQFHDTSLRFPPAFLFNLRSGCVSFIPDFENERRVSTSVLKTVIYWHVSCIDQLARVIYATEVSIMIVPDTKTKTSAEAKPKVESKPVVEAKAAGETKGKSRKLWIVVGLLVLVVAAGSAAFLAYPHFGASRNVSAENAGSAPKSERVKAILPLEPFLVNLADTNEVRFVKVAFQLGLEEEWKEESKNSVAIAAIRDSIISLLSAKTAEQIMTTEGKEKLRGEVRSRVNAVSTKMKVIDIYIVDFVVQL
jgi:flagellar protein FliL